MFRAHSVGGVLVSLILKILRVKLWTFVAYACFYFGLIRKFFLICREPVTSSASPLLACVPYFSKFFPSYSWFLGHLFYHRTFALPGLLPGIAFSLSPQFSLVESHVSFWTQLKGCLQGEDFSKRMNVCQLHWRVRIPYCKQQKMHFEQKWSLWKDIETFIGESLLGRAEELGT